VSKLVNGDVDGEQLTEHEFNSFVLLLAVAGNETTRNATSHGMRLLSEHPEQYEILRSDPERYVPTFIEEVLRFSPSVIHFRRTVAQETELRGVRMAPGTKVGLFYGSANRDEDVFSEPNRFDVTRDPNPHLAFGVGEHFCLGASLARMQLRTIFHEVVTRLPDMNVSEPPRRLRGNFIDGIKEMRVRYTPQQPRA
jgi:cytochrome P450